MNGHVSRVPGLPLPWPPLPACSRAPGRPGKAPPCSCLAGLGPLQPSAQGPQPGHGSCRKPSGVEGFPKAPGALSAPSSPCFLPCCCPQSWPDPGLCLIDCLLCQGKGRGEGQRLAPCIPQPHWAGDQAGPSSHLEKLGWERPSPDFHQPSPSPSPSSCSARPPPLPFQLGFMLSLERSSVSRASTRLPLCGGQVLAALWPSSGGLPPGNAPPGNASGGWGSRTLELLVNLGRLRRPEFLKARPQELPERLPAQQVGSVLSGSPRCSVPN